MLTKKDWLAVLAITFVAFCLRVYRLDAVSLRGDEAFTVVFVQRTWEGLWKGIRLIEPNPPLLYLGLRVWVALAGAGEFAARFFSAFFGVLCVPLVYRLAKELFGKTGLGWRSVALIAAALVAINPYQVWHSQDVRNYTLWPALSLASIILLWRWWKGEKGEGGHRSTSWLWAVLGLYVLATAASLYTHYYDTFLFVAENIFVVVTLWRQRASLARWFSADAVLAAVYLPWVLFFTNRVTTYGEPSGEQGVPLVDVFSRTLAALTLSDTMPGDLKTTLWIPLALAFGLALVYLGWKKQTWRAFFLLLYVGVPTLALYALARTRPLFLERYLNVLAPAYSIAFGVALAALWQNRRRAVGATLLALGVLFFGASSGYALSNYYFDPAYAKAPDWRTLSRFITARQEPGDIVVQNFTEMSLIYYESGRLPVITVPKDFKAAAADEQTLRQLNTDYARIWLIPAAPDRWDPDQFVESFLSRYDDRIVDTRVAGFRVQLYTTPRGFATKIVPVAAEVGDVTLVGYRFQAPGAANSSTLHVVLYWRAARRTEKDWTVFVHLADSAGRVLAQQDNAPVGGTYPTHAWQPGELIVDAYDLPAASLSGTLTLLTGMYEPVTLQRAPVVDAYGARLPDDQVTLTQITLAP